MTEDKRMQVVLEIATRILATLALLALIASISNKQSEGNVSVNSEHGIYEYREVKHAE